MKIIIKPDYESMSIEAAQQIAELIKNKPNAILGLATGSTPIGTYKELVKLHKNGLDFSNVITFNLDEYYGLDIDLSKTAEQDQSYKRFMHEQLFKHININPKNAHFLDGKTSKENIKIHCKEYEDLIKSLGGIDLQLLGIGGDGHVGFNEPGSSFDSRTRLIKLTKQTIQDNYDSFFKNAGFSLEQVPDSALTMGIGTILDSKKILLIVNGMKKSNILAAALQGPVTTEITASVLQNHPEKTTIILDKEGASKLKN